MISIDICDARKTISTGSTGSCIGDYYVLCHFGRKNPKITDNKVYPVWFKKFDSIGVDSSILMNALTNTGMNQKIFHVVSTTPDGLRSTEAYTTPLL